MRRDYSAGSYRGMSRPALLSQEGSTIETAVEIVRGGVPEPQRFVDGTTPRVIAKNAMTLPSGLRRAIRLHSHDLSASMRLDSHAPRTTDASDPALCGHRSWSQSDRMDS